jgi:hypothetical protein
MNASAAALPHRWSADRQQLIPTRTAATSLLGRTRPAIGSWLSAAIPSAAPGACFHQATGNAARPRIMIPVCQVSSSSGTAIWSPESRDAIVPVLGGLINDYERAA